VLNIAAFASLNVRGFAELREMTDKIGYFATGVDGLEIVVPTRLRDAGHQRIERRIVRAAPTVYSAVSKRSFLAYPVVTHSH
jgi:hypothetical protein